MYVKKKKAARRKTKKRYRTKRRRYQKGGTLCAFQNDWKNDGFLNKDDALQESNKI